jgi:glycosyltransferase involved in cell wall biosynthesis
MELPRDIMSHEQRLQQAWSQPPLVMHVFPSFGIGGAQERFIGLCSLLGGDYRHVVVSLCSDISSTLKLPEHADVAVVRLSLTRGQHVRNIYRILTMLDFWKPDLLITSNWGSIEIALANMWPAAAHIHLEDGFGADESVSQKTHRALVRRIALRRSTVAVPSRALFQIARNRWGLPARLVHHLPNGIDLVRFHPGPDRHDPDVVIGTVAALRPEKNLVRLLMAIRAVSSSHMVQLTIVGDGPENGALRARVSEIGLGARVRFMGSMTDVAAAYRDFDVFALSSDTEQMPLSVLEAMACGLPVVATDVGDIRSMVAACNRRFITPLDHRKLADALLTLIGDRQLRRDIGAANRCKAEHEYDLSVAAGRWRGLWDGALATR